MNWVSWKGWKPGNSSFLSSSGDRFCSGFCLATGDKYIYAQEQQAAIDLLYGRQFPFISTTQNGPQPMSRFKKRDQRRIVKWLRLKAPFNKTWKIKALKAEYLLALWKEKLHIRRLGKAGEKRDWGSFAEGGDERVGYRRGVWEKAELIQGDRGGCCHSFRRHLLSICCGPGKTVLRKQDMSSFSTIPHGITCKHSVTQILPSRLLSFLQAGFSIICSTI